MTLLIVHTQSEVRSHVTRTGLSHSGPTRCNTNHWWSGYGTPGALQRHGPYLMYYPHSASPQPHTQYGLAPCCRITQPHTREHPICDTPNNRHTYPKGHDPRYNLRRSIHVSLFPCFCRYNQCYNTRYNTHCSGTWRPPTNARPLGGNGPTEAPRSIPLT